MVTVVDLTSTAPTEAELLVEDNRIVICSTRLTRVQRGDKNESAIGFNRTNIFGAME